MNLILTCFLLLFAQLLFGQNKNTSEYKFDSKRIVILKEKNKSISKKATLSHTELALTDELFRKAIDDYNNKLDSTKDAQDFLITADYRRQYIPWIQDEQKFVYVNCFCEHGMMFGNWKKERIIVFDGGKCFFGLLINLSKKGHSDFNVNGKC